MTDPSSVLLIQNRPFSPGTSIKAVTCIHSIDLQTLANSIIAVMISLTVMAYFRPAQSDRSHAIHLSGQKNPNKITARDQGSLASPTSKCGRRETDPGLQEC